MMSVKHLVQEIIRRFNLFQLSGTCNNDLARPKDAHCYALAFSLSLSHTLTLTERLALTDSISRISGIVEEFSIHPLINGLFQHAKQVVFVNQNLMKYILINELIQCIIGIDKLNGESLNGWFLLEGRSL
jgi:hypothetical protein